MSATFETSVKEKVDVHYVNTGVPLINKESVEGYCIEHGDIISFEELEDQEIIHQSFLTNTRSDTAKASSSSDTSPGHDHRGDERRVVEEEEESLQVNNVESQLAADEALARSLQEFENQLTVSSVNETTEAAVTPSSSSTASSTANRENSTDTTTLVIRQDGIDPDNMTYEELRSLGEGIGTESRGLSEEVISYLPTETYKTGIFSRNDKHEECVICLKEYKNRDILIILPCQHRYHAHCVTCWLKLNKACPVCKEEVFG